MLSVRSLFLPALLSLLFCATSHAHPTPDVPVRSSFDAGGAATIRVEVDPRCFAGDPDLMASVLYEAWREMPEAKRNEYVEKARGFIPRTVEFLFDPIGRVTPEFQWAWTAKGGAPLAKDDDIAVLTGTAKMTVPAGMSGYRIRALPQGTLAVVFVNEIRGQQVERVAVLFPGETSFLLDLSGLNAPMPTGAAPGSVGVQSGAAGRWATFGDFLQKGFRHVLPEGLDHILFVLGLFLLSREWRPLLWQVTAFTVAHTITLGLATAGVVELSRRIVEPLIAASLVFVAVENILRPRYTVWRLVIVFGFGLFHGLGYASQLRDQQLSGPGLVVGLLGFNVGVEFGQIAVLALAFAATAWVRDPALYRRAIVIPGSAAIALCGVYWTIERLMGKV